MSRCYRILIFADLACSIVLWAWALADLVWGERRLYGTKKSHELLGDAETLEQHQSVANSMKKMRISFALRTISFLLQLLAATFLFRGYRKMIKSGSRSLPLVYILKYTGLVVVSIGLGGAGSGLILELGRWGGEVAIRVIVLYSMYSPKLRYRRKAGNCLLTCGASFCFSWDLLIQMFGSGSTTPTSPPLPGHRFWNLFHPCSRWNLMVDTLAPDSAA